MILFVTMSLIYYVVQDVLDLCQSPQKAECIINDVPDNTCCNLSNTMKLMPYIHKFVYLS